MLSTNKYKIPHYEFVLLGTTLLSDESSATLSWVMRTWLRAMGGGSESVKNIVKQNEEEFKVKFEECIYRPWTDEELEERNKYKIPHYEFVLLGTTLLSDESSATLSWVMRTWLRAMGGGSESVKNIVKQNEEEFKVKFEECIYRPWTDEELEERNKYKIPHYEFVLLGTTLLSDESSATLSWVMRTWLRAMGGGSESVKNIVKQNEEEFMVKFEECIYRPWTDEELEERFEEEAKADFSTWNEQPVLKSSSPFEKHMAGVYTHSVFKKFQIEVVGVVACICVSQKQDEKGSISYRIQDFMVTLNEEKAEVSCMCHLFELKGYLCRQAI
nr:protein FAR-RED ELONGATED HYPOCOTYL 3 isoform X2 [Ipomoea trifida]